MVLLKCLETKEKEKKKNTAFPLFAAWLWIGSSSVLSQTAENSVFVFPACPCSYHRSTGDTSGLFLSLHPHWACTLHSVHCFMCCPFSALTTARDSFLRLHISWAFGSLCCLLHLLSPSLSRHEQNRSLNFSPEAVTNTKKSTAIQGGGLGEDNKRKISLCAYLSGNQTGHNTQSQNFKNKVHTNLTAPANYT